MIHFLTGHEPFTAKLAQMSLKDSDKCICGSEQTTKHLWESCSKSEFKHLHNIEPNLTKILQDKDKCKEFQSSFKGSPSFKGDEKAIKRRRKSIQN